MNNQITVPKIINEFKNYFFILLCLSHSTFSSNLSFTSNPLTTANVGSTYTYPIKISDVNQEKLSLSSKKTLPDWLNINVDYGWEYVGGSTILDGYILGTSLAFDNGVPYVSYVNANYGISVRKFNSVDWVLVGNEGTTAARNGDIAINDGTPYTAYIDGSKSYKATVMKFDGTNWVNVGTPGFSTGEVRNLSISFNQGTPYVAYIDVSQSNKITVMKFDGTNWANVGSAGFSQSTTDISELIFNNGTPYIAYQDASQSNKATVMKFDGNNWVNVGAQGFTDVVADKLTLAVYQGIPHIAFVNGSTKLPKIMKFDTNNWVNIEYPSISETIYAALSLSFSDESVYYMHLDASKEISVIRFDGSEWVKLGKTSCKIEDINGPSIVINNGTPYVIAENQPPGREWEIAPVMKLKTHWNLTGTPSENDIGSHHITLQAEDGNSPKAEQNFTITVADENGSPVITSTAPTLGTEDEEWVYNVLATDIDNDDESLEYSLSDQPAGMTISKNKITWTPENGITSSGEVTLSVSDGVYSTIEKFTISVTPVNDAPVINSTPNTTATEDVLWKYTISASDIDNSILSYSIGNGPMGMSIADSVISWTPTEGQLTSGEVLIFVTDGEGVDIQKFTIEVTAVNDTPMVVQQIPDTTIFQDSSISISIPSNTFADIEGGLLTLSVTNLPKGLKFESSSNKIKGVAEDIGSTIVTITATDTGSLSVATDFEINVESKSTLSTTKHGNLDNNQILKSPQIVFANSEKITFNLPAELSGVGRFSIYDLAGTLLHKKSVELGNAPTFDWDLRNGSGKKVGAGTYVFIGKFRDENGQAKIVKATISVKY